VVLATIERPAEVAPKAAGKRGEALMAYYSRPATPPQAAKDRL